jgi:hypothetical protein
MDRLIRSLPQDSAMTQAAMVSWLERVMAVGTDDGLHMQAEDKCDFLAAYWQVASMRYLDR